MPDGSLEARKQLSFENSSVEELLGLLPVFSAMEERIRHAGKDGAMVSEADARAAVMAFKQALAPHCEKVFPEEIPKSSAIISEHRIGREAFLLLHGMVKLHRLQNTETGDVFAYIGAPGLVGMVTLLTGVPHPFSAVALTPCIGLRVGAGFAQVARNNPVFLIEMMRNYQFWVLDELKFRTRFIPAGPDLKVALLLKYIHGLYEQPLLLSGFSKESLLDWLVQSEMAETLGLTVPQVSTAINLMRKKGMIAGGRMRRGEPLQFDADFQNRVDVFIDEYIWNKSPTRNPKSSSTVRP